MTRAVKVTLLNRDSQLHFLLAQLLYYVLKELTVYFLLCKNRNGVDTGPIDFIRKPGDIRSRSEHRLP